MKKYILLFLLAARLPDLQAQVVLNLQLPPAGLTVKSQLWNLSVVNTANQPMQAQIELSMVSVSNNQTVLTATTRVLDFPKGLKQLHAGEVAPVIYNVLASGYNVDGSPEGFLPVGTFQLCYSLVRVDLETSERVAEECETVVVEPISPPQLVTPSDSEKVELPRPLFNWLPPSPVQLFNNLVYDFNLVEVQSLQTGADAIQQNIPLETESNQTVTNLQYPASLPELDTSKLYAWQITARSGGSEVARSEVWTFRVKKNATDSLRPAPVYYSRMKRETDAAYTVCYGTLYYEYLNEANDRQIPFKVYDLGDAARKELLLDSTLIDLHFGQQLGKLDFSKETILKDKHIYLLELINSRKEHWYLKFQYRKKT
ncbi:MAG TPA: hypothetical protein VNS58_18870 [Puia sp.]|nr:hypothetical protein [Puia sp.]